MNATIPITELKLLISACDNLEELKDAIESYELDNERLSENEKT